MTQVATCLWFNGDALEAAEFYTSLLPRSRIERVSTYPDADNPHVPFPPGHPMLVEFTLAGQGYQALNGGPHFPPSPAASICVHCEDTQQLDTLWDRLTDGGSEAMCGWLTDRFGISWQILPRDFVWLQAEGAPDKVASMVRAMLTMKKLDMAALRSAYEAG